MPAFPKIGTTAPIFVSRSNDPSPVRAGKDYFLVQIHAAQAAFRGSLWAKVKRLVVASNVAISRPGFLKENMKAIQRSRDVQPGRAVKLGLRPNLIGLVPAIMTDFSVSLEFIVDSEDRLKALTGIINDDNFLATVSLAPGAAMVAKTVSNLADKVVRAFLPDQEHVPILQFSGDFNLTAEGSEGLHEGYYVIMGSRDEEDPLPDAGSKFEVRDGELLVSGVQVSNLSYVILDVQRIGARTRERNDGAAWEAKLREAEDEARLPAEATPDQSWNKCRDLLREAQAVLRTDINYLRSEADAILLAALRYCKDTIFAAERASTPGIASLGTAPSLSAQDLMDLKVAMDPEKISTTLDAYAEQVHWSRRLLKQLGL